MPDLAMLDYFYGDEAEQFTFYRIPKVLFTDPSYRRISSDAKILYGLIEYRKNFRPFLRDKIKTSRNKNFLSAGSLGTV